MSKVSDSNQGLRLDHAELVAPDQHHAVMGMAWDAYLAAAVNAIPDVLNSLLTEQAITATLDSGSGIRFTLGSPKDTPLIRAPHILPKEGQYAESDLAKLEAVDYMFEHISSWVDRWGFAYDYAFHPAWNTLVLAARERRAGALVPDEIVSRWDGSCYTKWNVEDPEKRPAFAAMRPQHDGSNDWNPAGSPHPFPELADRLLAHEKWGALPRRGMNKLPASIAQEIGTQVLVRLPTLYWEPTAETREAARDRILEMISAILEADLGTIIQAHRAHGYRTPPEKRNPEHFGWLVRFQMLHERRASIALADGVDQAHVTRTIKELAALLGLSLRRERRGRPPKQHAHTVRITRR